jgi:hypothetical protein
MSEINWLVTRKETLEAIFQCYRNPSGTHGGYTAVQWLEAYSSQQYLGKDKRITELEEQFENLKDEWKDHDCRV